jgi:hypothetical protein
MALGLLGGQVVLCNPPQEAIGLMTPFIQTQLQSLVSIFPDQVTLIPVTASGAPNDPRRKLNAVRSAIKLTPFIPVLLLFGIAVFAVRSLAGWLTWWGWPFMFAGGSSVLIALFGAPVVGEILQFVIQTQRVIPIPPLLTSSLAETARAVASEILASMVIQGFILGFIGLGMVIVSPFLAKREEPL